MTPADSMELARQVHARAEAYGIEAWTAAVDVLNSGDEADRQRARELMVFVRHSQQLQAWMDGVNGLPPPELEEASLARIAPTWPTRPVWLQAMEAALGVLALFALLWIALAVLT